jgi:hypothetical protein
MRLRLYATDIVLVSLLAICLLGGIIPVYLSVAMANRLPPVRPDPIEALQDPPFLNTFGQNVLRWHILNRTNETLQVRVYGQAVWLIPVTKARGPEEPNFDLNSVLDGNKTITLTFTSSLKNHMPYDFDPNWCVITAKWIDVPKWTEAQRHNYLKDAAHGTGPLWIDFSIAHGSHDDIARIELQQTIDSETMKCRIAWFISGLLCLVLGSVLLRRYWGFLLGQS